MLFRSFDDGVLAELIDRILGADRALAVAAIKDGKGGEALDELAKADREAAKGNEISAIEHFRLAWERAQD